MTNLQKLETTIRTALPELMELSKGCQIREISPIIDNTYIVINKINNVVWLKEIYKLYEAPYDEDVIRKNSTIIGHPVTIVHLLRWLFQTKTVSILGDGRLQEYKSMSRCNDDWYDITTLDLSKPLLSQQSEEVINELCKMIV